VASRSIEILGFTKIGMAMHEFSRAQKTDEKKSVFSIRILSRCDEYTVQAPSKTFGWEFACNFLRFV
jgi:hypothetical protein